jgi:two-component system chemotaxis response regulator CheY
MSKIVLVVDDSVSVRQMLAFTLKCAGYTVIEAVDGKDALEKAKTNTFHMVFTDVNMPEMDGLVFTRSLRAMPKYKDIPIVVLTTESSDAMKGLGSAAGATCWFVKPINPGKLLEVTRKLTK